MQIKVFFLWLLFWLFANVNSKLYAQKSTSLDSAEYLHSPIKALRMSAALPGLGQVYNKKYWKPPVIYAGAATLLYFANYNGTRYKKYKTAVLYRLDGDSTTIDDFVFKYSDQDLLTLKTYFRRNRDLCYIGTGLLYVLNLLDAYVDAHLFYFTVKDDVIIGYQPYILNNGFSNNYGVKIMINFK